MTTAPAWSGAVPGQKPTASQVNALLATHAMSLVYEGTAQCIYTGANGSGYTSLGEYVDQPFTLPAGQTTIGWIQLYFTATGTPPDVNFSIQTDNAGVPSGTVLYSSTIVGGAWSNFFSNPGYLILPIGLSGLSASTKYHFVLQPAGTTGNIVTFTNVTSIGTNLSTLNTSTNGTTWTAGTGTLKFGMLNGTKGPLQGTVEDSGAKWVVYVAQNANTNPGDPAYIFEYTAPQGGTVNNNTRNWRALTYSSGVLSSVA